MIGRERMTVYEHFMVGANLVLAAGLQRRYGWRLAGLAGVAAASPDWDGLSILFGGQAYARAHRVWGHNLLIASVLGGLVGAVEYTSGLSLRIGRALRRKTPPHVASIPDPESRVRVLGDLVVWTSVGMVAALSHLLADYFYSRGPSLTAWPLLLLWPFSTRGWAWPLIAWGDVGATLIFIVEMFVLYRRPARAQPIAWLTPALVVGYVAARGSIE
jgi:membrane-bound metal-dependent hydrolase YbcI (DUF457 family)